MQGDLGGRLEIPGAADSVSIIGYWVLDYIEFHLIDVNKRLNQNIRAGEGSAKQIISSYFGGKLEASTVLAACGGLEGCVWSLHHHLNSTPRTDLIFVANN